MIERLSLLIGKWTGKGIADFPTIGRTEYREELIFRYVGDGESILFEQRTWFDSGDKKGQPLHWEFGFIIVYPDESIEFFNAQNSKRVEVMKASKFMSDQAGLELVLESKYFANDERMIRTQRQFIINNDSLYFKMNMATRMTPEFQLHLSSALIKTKS